MSGPKGATYAVVSEAELRRRRVAAARERLGVAGERLAVLEEQARSCGATAGLAPSLHVADDEEALAERLAAVTQHCDRLEAIIARRRVEVVLEQLGSTLEGFHLDLSATASSVPPGVDVGADRASLFVALDDLARKVATLCDGEREQLVVQLRAARAEAETADAARAAQAVGSLRSEVADALRREAGRVAFEGRRRALATEFADVTPRDPESAAVLAAARDEAGLASARRVLEAARDRLARAADQEFAVAQAAEALRALGYRVEVTDGDGVETLVARKDAWRHHGLRLLFPAGQAAFSSTPEAYGDTDVRDDVAFERASCSDIDALLVALADRGVPSAIQVHKAPGTVRVRRATGGSLTQRHSARPKERAL